MELALQDDATLPARRQALSTRERAFDYARGARGHPPAGQPALGLHDAAGGLQRAPQARPRSTTSSTSSTRWSTAAARTGSASTSRSPARRRAGRTPARPRQSRPGTSRTPREFGKWAGVVAEHFAGRVDRYSIWNEPNWKTWLGPLKAAPALYRSLYTRGYDGDQGGRPAGQGADRRDQPLRAPRPVHGAAGLPAQGRLRQLATTSASRLLPQAEGRRLRAPSV